MTARYRSLIAVAVGLAAALALGGCGVPISTTAGTLPQIEIPKVLEHPPQTTTTTIPSGGLLATVFFVQNGLLTSQTIKFPEQYRDVLGQSLLNALASGPNIYQEGQKIETDLPVGAQLKYLSLNGKIADVAVDNAFLDQAGTPGELELAQTVFTLIENDLGVTSVQFFFQGLPKEVVDGVGALVNGTVNLADYCPQIPRINKVPGCEPKPPKSSSDRGQQGGDQANP
jgi:hypothetical protein